MNSPESQPLPTAPVFAQMSEIPQELRDEFATIAGHPVSDDVIRLTAVMDRAGAARWAARPRAPALAQDLRALISVATAMQTVLAAPDLSEPDRLVTLASLGWVLICESLQGVIEARAADAIVKHHTPKPARPRHKRRAKPRRRK